MVQGLDVSESNGTIDWRAVARSRRCHFTIIKATEGETWTDSRLVENRAGARKFGIPAGMYHFARPDKHPSPAGATREAEHFCKTVGRLGMLELIPALDLERETPGPRATAAERAARRRELELWARTFSQTVRRELGRYPLFYSFPALIAALGLGWPIGGGLWLAHPGVNDGGEHMTAPPKPWKRTLVLQYTSVGKFPGVAGDVDLDDALEGVAPLYAHPQLSTLARPALLTRRALAPWR